MSKTPYEISDKAIDLLNRKAIKRFRAAQRKAAIMKFDELNVIRIVRELYDALEEDNRKAFLDLANLVYQKLVEEEEELEDMWLAGLLDEYDPVTLYQYSKEVPRKRDRATEAIIAAKDKGKEFQKALRYWARQTGAYADIVTDAARMKAFQGTGVKRVRWRTEDDDKVCPICGPRDKKIYDIDKVPVKPHPNCRCWLEAVKE